MAFRNQTAEIAHQEQLRYRVAALTDAQRLIYFERLTPQLRDPDTYAVLNYLFLSGLHHFYLKQWFRGGLNFFMCCIAILLAVSGQALFAGVIFGALFLVELPALFFSQQRVLQYNNAVAEHILSTLTN